MFEIIKVIIFSLFILKTPVLSLAASQPTLPPMPSPWVAPTQTPTPTPPKPIRNFYPIVIAKPNVLNQSSKSQLINQFIVTDPEGELLTIKVSKLPKYWTYTCNSVPGQTTCSINGTPKNRGTFSYTIKASDAKGATTAKSLSTRVIKLASNRVNSTTSY